MATKKYLSLEGLQEYDSLIKQEIADSISGKADSTHSHSNYVPTSRTINGKALTSNITLSASDVGALPSTTAIPSIDGLATEDYVDDIASTKVDKVSGKGLSTNDYTTTEKNKLSGIASGAEVNQNAFANVVVGSTTIAADSKTDSLTIAAGTGISVAGDATNDKVTITNSGVRSISTGSSNGTISVNTNGSSANVAVKGLGSAAYTASTAYDSAGSADTALASANEYTDNKIALLMNNSSEAVDSIMELATAMEENEDVVQALEDAIGTKANASALTSHTSNKSNPHGVTLSQLGVTATAAELNIMDGVTATAAEINKLDGLTATTAELNYVDGVTSNIQTQLDGKAASGHTHNYAGSSSAGGAATSANKVNSSLTVKLNGGTTEGTNMFTFNGSAAKSVDITPSGIGAAASSHTHDGRYYTESEIDSKLSGKANTSHGNHVPTTQTANNAVFLRNDNTWATVTPANIGAAASSHTHTVANISDLTATATELNYMDGVTSAVQTQLDGKAASSHSHSAATTSAAGFMSASDKSKLDGITASADSVSFSRSLSSGTKVGTITINGTGTDLYAPTNTDTHYTTGLKVGASATATANAAASNGSVYLNVLDNSTVRDSHKIVGSGATTVTSDANGVITISSTDNNTTYGAAGSSLGLVKSGGDVTISSGVITVNDDSHNHTIANIDNLQTTLDGKAASSHSHSAATTSAAGFMSASDKSKLDGIASGANAYSLPTATSSVLGGVKVGSNITNSSGTISLTKSNVTSALGYTPPTTNTTYSAATTSAAGLMSAADKTKLDGIATGANNYTYTLPTASSSTLGGVKTTSTVTSTSGLTACPIISGVPYYKDTNSTYSLSSFGVTATAAELNALDGITATVTELNYMDGVTSNVQTQLNGKAASSHTHNYAGSSSAGGSATSAVKLATARTINGVSFDGSANITVPATFGITTAGTGAAYTATVGGITSLTAGASFIMIPHTVSTSTSPTLNVNSLGAKNIRRMVSNSSTSTAVGYNASWLAASKPVRVVYNGTYWIVTDLTKPAAADMNGTLTVAKGGTGATTAAAALTNLGAAAKWNLLWTNASPTSTFAAQTLTLDGLSNYNLFTVVWYITDDYQTYMSSTMYVPVTTDVQMSTEYTDASLSTTKYYYYRGCKFNRGSNTIYFDTAYYANAAKNTIMIPLYILGTTV